MASGVNLPGDADVCSGETFEGAVAFEVAAVKDIFARVTEHALDSMAKQMQALAEECQEELEADVSRRLHRHSVKRVLAVQPPRSAKRKISPLEETRKSRYTERHAPPRNTTITVGGFRTSRTSTLAKEVFALKRAHTHREAFRDQNRVSAISAVDHLERVYATSAVNQERRCNRPQADVKGRGDMKAHVFVDGEAMKEHVRAAISRPDYNVTMLYRETGICQFVARSTMFEYVMLVVIALNAFWIAVDADYNESLLVNEADPVFQAVEHLFCVYFIAEIAVRYGAFKSALDSLKDFWFGFDFSMVCLTITQVWLLPVLVQVDGNVQLGNASILKIIHFLRLTRMARMAKLLAAFPELMILCRGVAVASRSVFFTLCLLFMVIYVFAVVFRQLTDGSAIGELHFATVPSSMVCLLLRGILPDIAEIVLEICSAHAAFGALFMLFILLASLIVMNMLVGVLVEVVGVVSSLEKEQMIVSFVKRKMNAICLDSGIDSDQDSMMTPMEFQALLMDPKAVDFMLDIGVDIVGLVEYVEFCFKDAALHDGEELIPFPSFMELLLQLRGANQATVKDIVDLRKFIGQEIDKLERRQARSSAENETEVYPPNVHAITDNGVGATVQERTREHFAGAASPNSNISEVSSDSDRCPLVLNAVVPRSIEARLRGAHSHEQAGNRSTSEISCVAAKQIKNEGTRRSGIELRDSDSPTDAEDLWPGIAPTANAVGSPVGATIHVDCRISPSPQPSVLD
eukprot:TRINITY_DN73564_c0_g1_i1.p1 TRINITY_DN73564_c0_g1~~TRINITY_DN73564_c0_g1_i1.p1  ORF type:complete len:763 (+),score=122.43 TRINITY_DN73564_c0_g1_i1:54-2291(+)